MSPKELLYIQDALDHVVEAKKCCNDFASQVQDPNLKTMLRDLGAKQEQTFNKFYSLLNA